MYSRYLLDREMSETEQIFRSFEDYVSKYRRILDYAKPHPNAAANLTAIHYSPRSIFILKILTHADYSKDRWENDL